MNLNDITTKPYILALIIRDDGERLLLGDGTYDFKDTLQHFQTDTFANDVVELQGADGQLLAGQVRRAGTQKFIGYIGDASMSKQKIEELRRAFLMFFRKKHFYKVVYIFCDGSAIQRKRGYIVNPPTAPEMWQKFPEYNISLNFEDVNYYEYEEDESGDEIYAHIVQIALAKALEGGLVWDAIGAVSDDVTWSSILSASGEYISIDNTLDRMAPLASVQIDGNAIQDGTPTPDSPVSVQVVTGAQAVKVEGKNLWSKDNAQLFVTAMNNASQAKLETYDGRECVYWTAGAGYEWEPSGGSQNIITVNGIDNARPIWQVVGPANNPTLTNITTGQTISWQGFVPIGQTLTIDMNEMTADLAGANVFEYITGTWIELRPGNNTLVYTADGGAEADSTLSWNGVAS